MSQVRHECALCEDCGWACETISIDRGKANMPAPAALPARLARSVTRPQEAKRRDCRMAIEPKFDKKGWRLFHSKSPSHARDTAARQHAKR
jgi:hypothetical protein